jgi:regulator of PEP synthase PpsR (kinase-PPPase family)
MQEYENVLVDNKVDGRKLMSITTEQLQSLGILDATHLTMFKECLEELLRGNSEVVRSQCAYCNLA